MSDLEYIGLFTISGVAFFCGSGILSLFTTCGEEDEIPKHGWFWGAFIYAVTVCILYRR